MDREDRPSTRFSTFWHSWRVGKRAVGITLLGGILLLLGWALFHVSNPGRAPWGCPTGCATRRKRSPGPLRVVTLNMLHGFPRFRDLDRRLLLIEDGLRRLDPDIVFLQEVPWVPRWGYVVARLGEETGLNDVYLRANGNADLIRFEEGESILSRYPLHDLTFTELQPQAGFFEHRVVLKGTAITPRGPVDVFVTHLTSGAATVNYYQALSLRAFVRRRARYPAIIAGDFNATEREATIQALQEGWIDAYRVVHPHRAGHTCCVEDRVHDGPGTLDKRIDYIFLRPTSHITWDVLAAQRVFDHPFTTAQGPLWASDHAGVLVALRQSMP